MKTLLLMRHAKSSWDDPTVRDHDRPLNTRGKEDAPRMGTLLNEQDLLPDVILCSSARRARGTVKHLLNTLHFEGAPDFRTDLYHADTDEYILLLNQQTNKAERVMIVGHNPEMNAALYHFTGQHEHVPTAGVAVIDFAIDDWGELDQDTEGSLRVFWKPRDV
jgi:phosphohistidine phosphatase